MDRIKVSGEDCYSAGAYLALDREAKCFEVACRSSNDLPAM